MTDQILDKNKLSLSFWEKFRNLLDEENMTQKEFCLEAGMKEKTLSAMICRNCCPDIYFISKVKNIFGVDFTFLIDDTSEDYDETTLSYKEEVVIELLRKGTRVQRERNLNAVAALLILQRGESLTSLDEWNYDHYDAVFDEYGLIRHEKIPHLFEFLDEFDRQKDIENGGDGIVYPDWGMIEKNDKG